VIRLAKSARVMAFVGVVALSGAALTACSSGSSSSDTTATGGGTYTWWDPYPQHNASSDWAKRVNACGTKAGVTIKRTGYDTTALTNQALLSAQEGTSPDIILLDNPAVSTLADTGMLNTTRELGLDTSNIDKNLLAAGVVKDKTYGIPIGANTLAVWSYREAFGTGQPAFSPASAVGNLLILIALAFGVLYLYVQRRQEAS
jgi:multiple sugar transport system substrate-binding protein